MADLATGLTELGLEVTAITSDASAPEGGDQVDFELRRLPSLRFGTDVHVRGLRRALRELRPDLIHIHSPLSIIATQASALAGGVPLVATYHGDFHKSSRPARLVKHLRNRLQLPYVLRSARTVIVLSEHDSRLLARLGIDPGRVVVVRPGLDVAAFQGARDGDLAGARRILYVGRVVYEKGVRELVTSFSALCDVEGGVELLVAGDGSALEDMRDLAARLGVGDRVRFLGWVVHEDLVGLYGGASFVVLPSFSEGLPYAVLEAMASGRPVVSSDVSGMRELVEDGVTGLLYRPSEKRGLLEAMLRLARDPEECRRLGAQAAERCRARFSRDRWLEDTVRVYETVV